MDREAAISEVASVFGDAPSFVKECLSKLAEFRKQLSNSRTVKECDVVLEGAFSDRLDEEIVEALAYERALEIMQAEEADKQSVASPDPFRGKAPVGG